MQCQSSVRAVKRQSSALSATQILAVRVDPFACFDIAQSGL
jgi:hypothetical protein